MPFCKMCFDSNRVGFDNHNVKDSAGNVTCTYLLNMKCYTCGNFGHTPKYCKAKTKTYVQTMSSVQYKASKTHSNTYGNINDKKSTNNFAILCEDQDIMNNHESYTYDNMEPQLPPVHEIIWGVGFASSKYISWADECSA